MPPKSSTRASKRVVIAPRRIGIDSISMFGRYNNARADGGLRDHHHAGALEICYLVRGRQTYFVGGESFNLRGGDVFLTLPDERHGTGGRPQEKGLLYWIILRNPSTTGGSLLGLPRGESQKLWRNLENTTQRHFRGAPQMKEHLDEVLRLFQSQGNALKKTALQNHIIAFLLQVIEAREKATSDIGIKRFAAVIRHIESNLENPEELTVDALASIARLSPSRFKCVFKEMLGVPPAEYALRLRIEEARRRLAAGNVTVTDVALDLGFSSSQYFATAFRRFTNMTPRAAMRKSAGNS